MMVDDTNSTSPSSFIPFCAYKTQLGISGPFSFLPNTSFPICKSFAPVPLDGQLCYNIKLDMKAENGKQGGLALVLDMNEDRAVNLDFLTPKSLQGDDTKLTLNSEHAHHNITGMFHIKLLSPFEGTDEGGYGLRSVKKITGTKDFVDMSEEDRKCKHEAIEDSVNRILLEKCNCTSWELATS